MRPSDAKGRATRELDELEEVSATSQVKAPEQAHSSKETDAAKLEMVIVSARGLLANLTAQRISVTEIKFVESGSRNGGTFGDVAIATFTETTRNEQGGRLAVKKIRFVLDSDMTEEKLLKLFANELRLLDRLSHPNIVRIIGFVEDIKARIAWFIFPWEENGNLREFLRSGTWEIPERVSLIIDVADGLQYLHTLQPPVCHGDLKSLNILVNSSHRAVITDFGSARVIGEAREPRTTSSINPAAPASHTAAKANEGPEVNVTVSNTAFTLTGPAWSLRWAAPEVLLGNPPNLASDIWALSWIAWEAITDRYPFEELTSEPQVTIKLIEGYLPSIYKQDQLSQVRMLCGSMQKCWKSDPKERPSATECWQTFRWIPNAIPVTKRGEQSATRSAALLLQIGELHRLQNRGQKAFEAFERGLTIARATGDRATEANLLMRLADNLRAQSRAKEAEAHFNEALAIFRRIERHWSRADALLGLGDVQRARSNYIQAESSYVEALVIYNSIGDGLGRANALLGLGQVHKARSKLIDAESSYAEALAIYKHIGVDLGKANALLGLGEVQKVQSKLIDAESFYSEALAIYRSIGNDNGRANALFGLGDVQQARSKYIEAESSYAEALAIYNSIGDGLGRANALLGLGDVQIARAMYVEAGSSYAESLAIYKSIGNDRGRVNSSLCLGEVRLHQARYAEAKTLVGDATPIAERLECEWAIGFSKTLLKKVLDGERSSIGQLTATPPNSTHVGDGNSPAQLPLPD